jgi:hypothetical protein
MFPSPQAMPDEGDASHGHFWNKQMLLNTLVGNARAVRDSTACW